MTTDSLATLIRFAKLQLDEKRKVVNTILGEIDRVNAEKDALLAERERERTAQIDSFEGGLTQGAYIMASLKKEAQLKAKVAQLEELLATAQDALRAAFEDVKRYEIAKDQRDLRAAKEAQKRATKQLDEVGSDRARRTRDETH